MSVSEVLDSLVRESPGRYRVELPEKWRQGRTIFGAIQAIAMLGAARDALSEPAPLRSLQTQFIGPIEPGPAFVEVEILRRGRSAIQAQARLLSGASVASITLAIFGQARPSSLQFIPEWPEPALTFDDAPDKAFVEGQTPECVRGVAQKWALGALPFTGGDLAHTQVYIHYPDEPEVSESLILAMADTVPSPACSVLPEFAQTSSMSWTLEFLRHDFAEQSPRGWLMDSRAIAAVDGYVHQDGILFAPDKSPFALSRQISAIFG